MRKKSPGKRPSDQTSGKTQTRQENQERLEGSYDGHCMFAHGRLFEKMGFVAMGKGLQVCLIPLVTRLSFWREGLTALGSPWASYRIKTTRIQYVYWLHLRNCEKLVYMTTSAAEPGWRGSRPSIRWMRKEGKYISYLPGSCDDKIPDKPTEN